MISKIIKQLLPKSFQIDPNDEELKVLIKKYVDYIAAQQDILGVNDSENFLKILSFWSNELIRRDKCWRDLYSDSKGERDQLLIKMSKGLYDEEEFLRKLETLYPKLQFSNLSDQEYKDIVEYLKSDEITQKTAPEKLPRVDSNNVILTEKKTPHSKTPQTSSDNNNNNYNYYLNLLVFLIVMFFVFLSKICSFLAEIIDSFSQNQSFPSHSH